jgi:type II secretory pathway predicted ATPase ExeA
MSDESILPSARAALDLPDQERILFLRQPRWIGYTRSKQVLGRMEALMHYPSMHRMPNLLIVAETNNGKTTIARRFARLHPAADDRDSEHTRVPVLLLQASPAPDEGRFYNSILEALHAPYRPSEGAGKKEVQVIKLLRTVGLRMLIIDEIHNLLAGSLARQRLFLNVLKYLGNELQVPIVGVGTVEAIRAVATDPQLANRFEPLALTKWEMNREYLFLLASFTRLLPLRKPSSLIDNDLALKLLSMSEGTIGELSSLLATATEHAISSARERIDLELLREIDWIPASERSRRAARLA